MILKEFLGKFDFNHPDFSAAPADFPNSSLSGLTSAEVGKFLAAKTEWEISRPSQPDQRSRQSQTPNGYIHLVAWSNACLLRILMTAWFRRYRGIYGYNKGFYRNLQDFRGPEQVNPSKFLQNPLTSSNFYPSESNPQSPYSAASPLTSLKSPLNSLNFTPAWLNPKLLDRLEAQLLDALRSTIANIEEGYGRPTTIEYINFLGYTQASLKEAKGDVQRMKQDGLLASKPGSKLADLGIDLAAWHAALKQSVISRPTEDKGFYRNLKDFMGPERKNPGGAGPFPLNPPKSPLNSSNSKGLYRNLEDSTGQSTKFLQSPLNSYNFGYAPVDNFDPVELTYEMLIELINKTDWNLRQLVGSLETKLNSDQKAYQIDRARILGKANWPK